MKAAAAQNSRINPNHRVLIGDLDSTHQADLVGVWRHEGLDPSSTQWQTRLDLACGRLRLETLLSERVVLTDAQAFDGAIVMRLAASGCLEKLRRAPGQPVPIELRIRHTDPERALWLMYHREDGARRPFLPSFFSGERGLQATATATAQGSPTSSDAVTACVHTLTRAGASPTEIDEAVDGWRALLDACTSHVLPTSVWKTEPPFTKYMEASESLWTSARLRADHCLTPSASEMLDEVLASGQDRSRVYRLLDQVQGGGVDEDMERAAGMTRLWYNERYRRALAFQHDADYRGSDAGLLGDDTEYRRALARISDAGPELLQIEVQLPAGLIEFLGDMEPHSWQYIVGLHQRNLRLWWDEGNTDAIRRVLDYLIDEADRVNGRPETTHSFVKSFGVSLIKNIGGMGLSFDPRGAVAVFVIQVLGSALEAGASRSPTRANVEVTDYVDDATV